MDLICYKCGNKEIGQETGLLTFLCHGRTEMNEKNIVIGSIDDPLSGEGRKQAQSVAESLKKENENYGLIISFPLSLTKETAAIIAEVLDLEIFIDSRARERCVGEYEGRPDSPEFLKKFLCEELPAPSAEPLSAFKQRVFEFLGEIIQKHSIGKSAYGYTHFL